MSPFAKCVIAGVIIIVAIVSFKFYNGEINFKASTVEAQHALLNVLPQQSMSKNGIPTSHNGYTWGQMLNADMGDVIK